MKTLPIALQMYSVRDSAWKDYPATLRAVKAAGYDAIELCGHFNLSPEDHRKLLDEIGLRAVSAHIGYEQCSADPDAIMEEYRQFGLKYVVIPHIVGELAPGGGRFGEFMANIAKFGDVAKRHGLTLLYHNHDFEFNIMPDGSFGIDYLYSHIPEDLLQTELDTCWIHRAGQDPVAYLARYANRSPVVHLKDYDDAETMHFCPLGRGMMNIPAVLAAAVDAGSEFCVVEQDFCYEQGELNAIAESRAYLRSLGW